MANSQTPIPPDWTIENIEKVNKNLRYHMRHTVCNTPRTVWKNNLDQLRCKVCDPLVRFKASSQIGFRFLVLAASGELRAPYVADNGGMVALDEGDILYESTSANTWGPSKAQSKQVTLVNVSPTFGLAPTGPATEPERPQTIPEPELGRGVHLLVPSDYAPYILGLESESFEVEVLASEFYEKHVEEGDSMPVVTRGLSFTYNHSEYVYLYFTGPVLKNLIPYTLE